MYSKALNNNYKYFNKMPHPNPKLDPNQILISTLTPKQRLYPQIYFEIMRIGQNVLKKPKCPHKTSLKWKFVPTMTEICANSFHSHIHIYKDRYCRHTHGQTLVTTEDSGIESIHIWRGNRACGDSRMVGASRGSGRCAAERNRSELRFF